MKEVFAYTRVSTVRQGERGVSLQEQRDAIERYATRKNLTVSRWYEERETAAKTGRPVFAKMLKLLRKQQASGVILHRIDRGTRNFRDWADLGELGDQGIEVHIAMEDLDLSSRSGQLAAGIQVVIAADYIRNLRDEVRKGFYGRLKQGLYPLPAPIGYLDCGTGKVKEIDPVRGPLVAQAFDLYASGEYSIERLRGELIRRGLSNRNGKPVSKGAVSRLLNNIFYTGVIEVRKTGETFSGIHAPLIAPDTFRRVQRALSGKTNIKVRRHTFTYKQLLTCASCLRTLTGERQKGRVYYRCHNRECRGSSVREDDIDHIVGSALNRVALSKAEVAILKEEAEKVAASGDMGFDVERKELDLKEIGIRHRLERLTDLLIDEALPVEACNQRREGLLLDLKQIEQRRAEINDKNSLKDLKLAQLFELAETAQLCHDYANQAEKRELLLETCSNFLVDRKYPTVELFPAYHALANRERVPSGGPCRDIFRTMAWEFARSANDHVNKINPSWQRAARKGLSDQRRNVD
tara:strand:+ start:19449 stop:21017 length:1569 start_codon:yes stop_codon:yes gene_type:complete